jgi:hypothetical protein
MTIDYWWYSWHPPRRFSIKLNFPPEIFPLVSSAFVITSTCGDLEWGDIQDWGVR